jgi:hypothetical protein
MDAIAHYRRRRKIALIALGGVCVECGSSDHLELDHIDPSTKTIDLSRDWYNDGWWHEVVTLCQLLCKKHHRQKSAKESAERNQKDRSLLHGTISQYYRYKCRCVECRKAYSLYRVEQRKKLKRKSA